MTIPVRTQPRPGRRRTRPRKRGLLVATALLAAVTSAAWPLAVAAPARAASGAAGSVSGGGAQGPAAGPGAAGGEGNQLESAAHRASETGRKVAMSLIALGFAIAAIVLCFRRDFKEAVAVFAIGVVAVLFAQEAGVKLVENLVRSLVG